MSELSLDDDQGEAFAGHLDRVRVCELVRCETSAYAGRCGDVMKLRPDLCRSARIPGRWAAHDAEHPADRQRAPQGEPWLQVLARRTSIPISRRLSPFP